MLPGRRRAAQGDRSQGCGGDLRTWPVAYLERHGRRAQRCIWSVHSPPRSISRPSARRSCRAVSSWATEVRMRSASR